MLYKVEDLVKDVRVAIDENREQGSLFSDSDPDTLMLEDIIRSKVTEGIDTVHLSAPYHLLHQGHVFGADSPIAVHWESGYSGWFLLPDDFLRLVVFRMSDWERPVYEVIGPDAVQWKMQYSRLKGLRGTPQKPVVTLEARPSGRALAFHTCKDDTAGMAQGMYIPYAEIDADGKVDISEKCYTAVVYCVAGMAMSAVGENDKATVLLNMSKAAMQRHDSGA